MQLQIRLQLIKREIIIVIVLQNGLYFEHIMESGYFIFQLRLYKPPTYQRNNYLLRKYNVYNEIKNKNINGIYMVENKMVL